MFDEIKKVRNEIGEATLALIEDGQEIYQAIVTLGPVHYDP